MISDAILAGLVVGNNYIYLLDETAMVQDYRGKLLHKDDNELVVEAREAHTSKISIPDTKKVIISINQLVDVKTIGEQ